MYFAVFSCTGQIQPQIIGISSSLDDIEKLIMAKLTFEYEPYRINEIPFTHISIGLQEDINNIKHKSIKTLELYSRTKENKLKCQYDYNEESKDIKEEPSAIKPVSGSEPSATKPVLGSEPSAIKPVLSNPEPNPEFVPYVVRYVNHKHITSYFLTFKQVMDLQTKFVYFNKVEKNNTNIISIFEASNQCIDFIHILHTINETCYNDYAL